ncbi:MAG: hypothetical protein ACRELE_11345 [Gemmatimonadales bacterium]
MTIRPLQIALLLGFAARSAAGQDTLPGSRITNAGVVRATRATAAVFISRTRLSDTIDIGDFASLMLARIGAPPFSDSLAFKVTADTQRVRVSGRLMDFPPDSRAELGPIFSFLDSTSVFVAEISMPQAEDGIMVFRLERLTVRGFPIPDLLVLAALERYRREYPRMLSAGGKEFHVEIPREAHAALTTNGVVLVMPPKP